MPDPVSCDVCGAGHLPEELGEGATCPSCGRVIAEERAHVPWHFKLLILATVIYLVWRLVQGIVWVVHHV